MWKNLTQLLVSNTCYACDEPLNAQETHVCLKCLSLIEPTGFHLSPRENELYYRLAGRFPLEGAVAHHYFDKGGRMQRLIEALKYQNAPQLGVYLGRLYAAHLAETDWIGGVEALVPVPLHPSRLISRGYNQAACVAEGMAAVLQIPVREDLLRRVRRTQTQTRKGAGGRWANMQQAFQAGDIQVASVMLIDDVITSGATLEACAQALIAGGHPGKGIWAASLAMTRQH